jgi:hypothetical protein
MKTKVVCKICNDTHQMWLTVLERNVLCTACPVPCDKCQQGAFCKEIHCSCSCHKEKKKRKKKRQTTGWFEGSLTKDRLAELRFKLAKARGLLISFTDPDSQYHPDLEEIKIILKETEDP